MTGAALLAPAVADDAATAVAERSPAEVLAASGNEEWRSLDPANTLYLELEKGRVVIERTDSASFSALIASRRNRPEEFFVYRPDHIDVCGVPVPTRSAADSSE